MKKLLLISICMVAMLCAHAQRIEVDGICYELNDDDNTAEVKRNYNESYSGHISIPNNISYENKTYKVTSIGASAFANCRDLKNVGLPRGLTFIDDCAFSNSGLESIFIPKNVTSIGFAAFASCDRAQYIDFSLNSELKSIGKNAFIYCESITKIYDLDKQTYLTSIGDGAFYGCTSLPELTIPSSVTEIGSGSTFKGCPNLTLKLESDIHFKIVDGTLYTADMSKIIFCPESKDGHFVIPNSVTSIGCYAFEECSSLTEITIPNSVTSIDRGAFYNCN